MFGIWTSGCGLLKITGPSLCGCRLCLGGLAARSAVRRLVLNPHGVDERPEQEEARTDQHREVERARGGFADHSDEVRVGRGVERADLDSKRLRRNIDTSQA